MVGEITPAGLLASGAVVLLLGWILYAGAGVALWATLSAKPLLWVVLIFVVMVFILMKRR
jgi:uncharacterized membrane protein